MWSEEEKKALFDVNACGSAKDVLAIATRAVELVRARGSKERGAEMSSDEETALSPEEVETAIVRLQGQGEDRSARALRRHIATQGARLAVLEPSEKAWRTRVEKAAEALEGVADGELGRLDLAGRIAELKRQRDEAVAARETYATESGAFQKMYAKAVSDRNEAVEVMNRLEAEAHRLKSHIADWEQRQEVERRGAQKRSHMLLDAKNHWSDRARAAESRLAAIRERANDSNRLLRLTMDKTPIQAIRAAMEWVLAGDSPKECPGNTCDGITCESESGGRTDRYDPPEYTPGGQREAWCAEPLRYPCSPTCAHDDAVTPGHPERVKERSGAFKRPVFRDAEEENTWANGQEQGLKDGYESGAEAMRAACWEAVQRVAETLALGPTERGVFKHAIEGAAP